MRLIDIKRGIDIAYENFDPRYGTGNNGIHIIDNIQKLKIAILELYDIGFIERREGSIIDIYTIIECSMTDRLIVDNSQISGYKNLLDNLKVAIDLFHQWINRYLTTEDLDTTISIKLPQISNLDELAQNCLWIRKSLSRVVSEIGGEAKFNHLEYGSNWVIIDVQTIEAVTLVAAIVVSAAKSAKLYSEFKLNMAKMEQIKLDAEIVKTVYQANLSILKHDINSDSIKIEKEHFLDKSNPERIKRIEVAIDNMKELISAGGEVHPSLIASKEVVEKFPSFKEIAINKNIVAELPRNNDVGTNKNPEDKEPDKE